MNAHIRLASVEDSTQIYVIYAPVVLNSPASFEYEPPTPVELGEHIRQTLNRMPWLVLEIDDMIAGYAYASSHRPRAAYQWSVDVSVYVHHDYRRRGVGTALYTPLLELLRMQGYYNAFAGITLPNPASVRLHESLGFQPLGIYRSVGFKLDAWHDVGWWQRPLMSLTEHPTPPQSIKAAGETEDLEPILLSGISYVK